MKLSLVVLASCVAFAAGGSYLQSTWIRLVTLLDDPVQCADTQCRNPDGSCPAGTQGVGCTGLCSAQCGGGVMGCGCAGGPTPPAPPSPPAPPGAQGPCDIAGAAGTPCVAAHSTTRALYSGYRGPLYQLKKSPDDGTTQDVGVNPNGFAQSSDQDNYCNGGGCVIQRIYDQSPKQNHLDPAPAGGAVHTPDAAVNANKEKLTISGNPVYAAYFEGGMGYRNDNTNGIATGDDPETIYMVAAGQHFNDKCCFGEINCTHALKSIIWLCRLRQR